MKLSFVIPTYNYARFLQRCLNSVIQQEADDYEIIIVDDGSTDETADIVLEIRHKNPGKEILYLYQQNAGPSVARNKGAAHATGEYLWFLDADDMLLAGSIRRMLTEIDKNPEAWFIFSGYRSVNDQGKKSDHHPTFIGKDRTENFRRYIQKKIEGIATGSAVIKKRAFESMGFPEDIHNNEDMVLYAHLFARYPAVSVPGIVLETYRHSGSLRNNLMRIEETGLKTVERLFDKTLLTPEQMSFRQMYLARRNLSIFRSYYRTGNQKKARAYYHRAIRECPRVIFEWSYLRKYIRCIGRK